MRLLLALLLLVALHGRSASAQVFPSGTYVIAWGSIGTPVQFWEYSTNAQLYLLQAQVDFGMVGDGVTANLYMDYYYVDHVGEVEGPLGRVTLSVIYALSGTTGQSPDSIFFGIASPTSCNQDPNPGGDQFVFNVCQDGAPIAQYLTGNFDFKAISAQSGGVEYGLTVMLGASENGNNWAGTLSSLSLICTPVDSCNQIVV